MDRPGIGSRRSQPRPSPSSFLREFVGGARDRHHVFNKIHNQRTDTSLLFARGATELETAGGSSVGEAVRALMREAVSPTSVEVSLAVSPSHPDIVLLDPERGLIAIDLHDSICGEAKEEFVELNRRVDSLQSDLPSDVELPTARVLATRSGLSEAKLSLAGRVLVPTSQLEDLKWLNLIQKKAVDQKAFQEARAALFPNLNFTAKLRRGHSDTEAENRNAARTVLDRAQARIADMKITDTVLLTGPPGSGKTLVLAARARLLARDHPDWNIQFLCFNTTLVPYLQRLVHPWPNIKVAQISEIASDFGIKFNYKDDKVTAQGLKAAMQRGKGLPTPFDAVLIDEVQDFHVPWLEIAHSLLRPHRGGMLLAGDQAQAIYNESDAIENFLANVKLERLELTLPYRSTRPILSAIQALDPTFKIVGCEQAPAGPPVDLVWAQSWDEQAKCVAWEVKNMLAGGDLQPCEIGILVTTYSGAYKRLERELDNSAIPYSMMDRWEKSAFDLFSNTVKVLTVHSAKGYEFKAVVLFGLEAIKDPDPADPESMQRARLAFVGATRAKDYLLITYTRDNKFLTRLSEDPDDVRRYAWPDDYEGVPNG